MVATLSLLASATTPVFASTGGTTVAHKSFDTGVTSTATVQKASTQATQAPAQRELTASESHLGFNAVNGDASTIKYKQKDGTFAKGWFKDGNRWMYADSNSIVQLCKWVQDGNSWYYLDADGHMLTGCNVDGYHLNSASGAWDGNAVAGQPNSTIAVVLDKSSNKLVSLTYAEFKSKVTSGAIKVNITHSAEMGGTDTSKSAGSLEYYLAN